MRIVQRGAVRPLIKMLDAPDPQLKEMAAFALGRLAQVCSSHMTCCLLFCPFLEAFSLVRGSYSAECVCGVWSAQNSDNQAGIAHDGGLKPLLEILDSKNGSLQHNAAFALYGLADNEVKTGGGNRPG